MGGHGAPEWKDARGVAPRAQRAGEDEVGAASASEGKGTEGAGDRFGDAVPSPAKTQDPPPGPEAEQRPVGRRDACAGGRLRACSRAGRGRGSAHRRNG